VVASIVILDVDNPIEGLTDSKKITAKKRKELSILIKSRAKAWAIGSRAL
jgi:ribonuclease HII